MYHDTCVTHVSWCMSGSLTRRDGENVPGIYIYIIVEKSPNSSHMYDHGFLDNTNHQAVKTWLDSQTRDASLTSWRQPFCKIYTYIYIYIYVSSERFPTNSLICARKYVPKWIWYVSGTFRFCGSVWYLVDDETKFTKHTRHKTQCTTWFQWYLTFGCTKMVRCKYYYKEMRQCQEYISRIE